MYLLSLVLFLYLFIYKEDTSNRYFSIDILHFSLKKEEIIIDQRLLIIVTGGVRGIGKKLNSLCSKVIFFSTHGRSISAFIPPLSHSRQNPEQLFVIVIVMHLALCCHTCVVQRSVNVIEECL